ncbi:hypothetical protein RclHR1_16770002 [Rhizophagus clarus]|uniref:Uncharacterized protein n=1 Tax=Rhizophagus clarus TaxID=94130 RepID=A0A2Z6QJR4_9GLOM|nr:hypothetical protein RclHR1_16770002 [Rhizophagus clarus]
MDKFKSFYGTLLIIIILLNFVSVCATNEGSKKNKGTDGSVDNGSGTKTSTEKPSHTVTPTKGGNAPSSSGSPSASPPGGETSSSGGGTSPPGGASPPGGGTSPPGGGGASPPGGGTSPPGASSPGGGGASPPGGGTSPPGGGASSPGGGTSPPGGGASSPGGGTSPPGGGASSPGGGTSPPGASSPGGGTSPPGASSPGGGAPGTPSAPSIPSTGTGTIPGGESNATMLAYVLFSNSPSTTTIGRPEVKGLISLFQPPNGNTVVTGQIGAILDRINGNYKFTIQDGGGVIYYDCTGRVNPLFIGQASLFSFTWSDIKLPIAIGKHFVITESGGTLVNGLIVEEFGFP